MERLEAKQVNGRTYYYYSKWARKDGRCRRVWQKYLGKLEDIVQAVDGGPPSLCAEVFQWGLPESLWREACRAELIPLIDRHCRKRRQGLSVGQYLTIAAINRAICPKSKRSMWDAWVCGVRFWGLTQDVDMPFPPTQGWSLLVRCGAPSALFGTVDRFEARRRGFPIF